MIHKKIQSIFKTIASWGGSHPDYVFRGDSLINNGLYKNNLSTFDYLLTFALTKSTVLNYFNIDIPLIAEKDFTHCPTYTSG